MQPLLDSSIVFLLPVHEKHIGESREQEGCHVSHIVHCFLAVLCIIVTLSIVGSRTAFNPFPLQGQGDICDILIALNAMNMVLVWTSCKTKQTGENRAETVEED